MKQLSSEKVYQNFAKDDETIIIS